MRRIIDLAAVVRSKNAGPLWLTLDVLFNDRARYESVLHAESFTAEAIGARYGVDPADVRIIPYDVVNAIKVTLPRMCAGGDLTETDVYGCQQHLPLAMLPIPGADEEGGKP